MDMLVQVRVLAIGLWLVLVVLFVLTPLLVQALLDRRANRRPRDPDGGPKRAKTPRSLFLPGRGVG